MSDDEVGLGRCPAVTDGGHRCVYPVGHVPYGEPRLHYALTGEEPEFAVVWLNVQRRTGGDGDE